MKVNPMSRNLICFSLSWVLLLSGCVKLPNDYELYQEEPSSWAIEQNNTRLQDIARLVLAGKGYDAKQQADLIKTTELTAEQHAQFNLLSAQILLSFGEAEQALGKLTAIDSGQMGISDKIKFYQSQAFAYSLTGNLLGSAKARVALDTFLPTPDERKKNQGVILETLGLLPESVIHNPQIQSSGLTEWVSIAKTLSSRNQSPTRFNAALANWKAINPDHPANLFVATVANMPEDSEAMPTAIAVILPESGPFLDAAKAIKAGFMAAHNSQSTRGSKPELHFYGAVKGKISVLYQKAVQEGAKLVIGPLNKEDIQSLANSALLTVPVLALNHIPNLSKQNLYQFAISPLDDVAEITKKAAMDGHIKAALLIPNNDQSKRISFYFDQDWTALNGVIQKKEIYDLKKTDFSSAINNLIGTDQNESHTNTAAYVPPSQSAPPHRPNAIDALFLSAYAKEGRIINSMIPKASNLPVYALPTIYSGLPDPAGDSLLNGITFCDIPWLFNGAYSGELSMMSLRDILNQFPMSYIRLVAMGIDAYHLAGNLTTLSSTPYAGATGNLTLDSDNRIKRSLVCAKFVKGQPELIGFTHNPTADNYSDIRVTSPVITP